jgi:magnesium transporter
VLVCGARGVREESMAAAADMETPIQGTPWVNLRNPASPRLDSIAAAEGFHPLDVEDCRHRNQIAKVLTHETYSYIVIKLIRFRPEPLEIEFSDFDIFVKPTGVTTVQEDEPCDLPARVAARLDGGNRPATPWRVLHAILDTTVDDYLPVLDQLGECIDRVDENVLEKPSPEVLQRILALKRLLIEFRRNATAMREVLNHLLRSTAPGDEQYLYLRDVYDHLVRVIDFVETYRDLVSGALDIYLSAIANRTNDIVKVLTIWGTVALPLIVITGFYGMNLDLPFQHRPHGMAVVAALMIGSTAGIMFYFKRKGWF